MGSPGAVGSHFTGFTSEPVSREESRAPPDCAGLGHGGGATVLSCAPQMLLRLVFHLTTVSDLKAKLFVEAFTVIIINLSIWLCRVLAVACRLFRCSMWGLVS